MNLQNITAIYLGSTTCKAIYFGDTKVWPNE